LSIFVQRDGANIKPVLSWPHCVLSVPDRFWKDQLKFVHDKCGHLIAHYTTSQHTLQLKVFNVFMLFCHDQLLIWVFSAVIYLFVHCFCRKCDQCRF